jgi:hypothetical protein
VVKNYGGTNEPARTTDIGSVLDGDADDVIAKLW